MRFNIFIGRSISNLTLIALSYCATDQADMAAQTFLIYDQNELNEWLISIKIKYKKQE